MAEAGTKLSQEQKIQVVRDAFASFQRGDLKGVADSFSADIVWHGRGSTKFGGDFRGKDAVIGMIAQYAQDFQDIKQDVHDILANDRHVVALVNSASKRNGKAYDDQNVFVFHVNDAGKTTEAWLIGDTEMMKAAFAT
jgi:uncharacterized protein